MKFFTIGHPQRLPSYFPNRLGGVYNPSPAFRREERHGKRSRIIFVHCRTAIAPRTTCLDQTIFLKRAGDLVYGRLGDAGRLSDPLDHPAQLHHPSPKSSISDATQDGSFCWAAASLS